MGRKLKPCGTRAAYQRHKDRGEDPCLRCRAANADRTARLRDAARPRPTVLQHPRPRTYDPGPDMLAVLRELAGLFPHLNFTQNGLNDG